MSDDLLNEQEAMNSIYGEHTLDASADNESHQYTLTIPSRDVTFRLFFPPCYPEKPPNILGTVTTGEKSQRRHARHALTYAREILDRVFIPGTVCIFDLLQELDTRYGESLPSDRCLSLTDGASQDHDDETIQSKNISQDLDPFTACTSPEWVASSTITIKRSVFVARACLVASPSQAKTAIAHLLANDKRVAKATHNITAHRIRSSISSHVNDHREEIVYQDCNDDGETAAGGRVLHLLQLMNVWDVCIVVSVCICGSLVTGFEFGFSSHIMSWKSLAQEACPVAQRLIECGNTDSELID